MTTMMILAATAALALTATFIRRDRIRCFRRQTVPLRPSERVWVELEEEEEAEEDDIPLLNQDDSDLASLWNSTEEEDPEEDAAEER